MPVAGLSQDARQRIDESVLGVLDPLFGEGSD
jgi:hypothetical protein